MDFKEIGFAAKDIIIGMGAATAGATGGPAAAEGVNKAGTGIDRILAMALPEEKKPSRAEKFDRADFGNRQPVANLPPPSPVSAPPQQQQQQPQQQQPQAPPAVASPPDSVSVAPVQKPNADTGPLTGDAKLAWDHLRELGWSNGKIHQILAGPEQSSLAAITSKETKGFRAFGAAGSRMSGAPGTAVPIRTGRLVPPVVAEPVPLVRGVRIKDDLSSS